ncbi:GNAT family N-acetyltransferase [Lactococcus petauri]|nr:GNAT family N-acetyltransferase [Lactococcus petauri]USI66609.1 GNAT family N-acetyltransferase [Lactococcus petauri]WJE13720.1 GNAT family N-acetyltransferase [Lactococcus petauri]
MNDWFIDLDGSTNLKNHMEENGYVFFKQENNLLYLSRRKVFELDFDIFLQEGEMYKEIGYMQGTYNNSKKSLNLFRIGVRPEYRDKGYGTKLYKLLENEA